MGNERRSKAARTQRVDYKPHMRASHEPVNRPNYPLPTYRGGYRMDS